MAINLVPNTDAVFWYNVGVFGKAGYGVPNFGNKVGTLNMQIASLVNLMGRSLFAIMHHEDARMRTPPSINTILRIHKLYVRAGQLLTSRAVPLGEVQFETTHVTPAGEIFNVYPCPYHLVRSPCLKHVASLAMMMLSEMMQHTENTKTQVITTNFSGRVGSYLTEIYYYIATEYFNISREEAKKPGFLLTDEQLAKYNPAAWFTSTEMVDNVPSEQFIFTEDQLLVLSNGIPATSLPDLKPWPVTKPAWASAYSQEPDAQQLAAIYGTQPSTGTDATTTAAAAAAGPVFPTVSP